MSLESEDHGFNRMTDLNEDWLREGLAFVTDRWLK